MYETQQQISWSWVRLLGSDIKVVNKEGRTISIVKTTILFDLHAEPATISLENVHRF